MVINNGEYSPSHKLTAKHMGDPCEIIPCELELMLKFKIPEYFNTEYIPSFTAKMLEHSSISDTELCSTRSTK